MLLFACPLTHAHDRCRAKLIESDDYQNLSDKFVLYDLEAERDHYIARLYNYRNIKSTDRPFSIREELRYFMYKQEGPVWLEKGTQLLTAFVSGKKDRLKLSEGERLLADGTLLFLKIELYFENADILDEKNRIERMEIEHDIAVKESLIDERRAMLGQEPLEDRMYSEDHPAKLNRDIGESHLLIKDCLARMADTQDLLKQLVLEGVYSKPYADPFTYTDPPAYWQGLGYRNLPY